MTTPANVLCELARDAAAVRDGRRCGRYAPSPTGPLHLGNVRTALVAWLAARLDDAVFVMRMEDLDGPRTRAGSAAQMLEDLAWLGLDWDEGPDCGGPLGPYVQSARHGYYDTALARLRDLDLAYPCFCSRRDIAEAASAPHGQGAVYPGTCRALDLNQRTAAATRIAPRNAAWRFRVPDVQRGFDDAVYGARAQPLAEDVGDFVVRRSDRLFAYQLAVVVDDALMGVSDVVRGADLLDSTPRQLALVRALDLPQPRYLHVPLVFDHEGRRMAKRDGSESLLALRERGMPSPEVVGILARSLGLIDDGGALTAKELLRELDRETLVAALRRAATRAEGEDMLSLQGAPKS